MNSIRKLCVAGCAAALVASAPALAAPGFAQLGHDEAIRKAESEKKIVFLDFYTTWCAPCKIMDENTFADKDVIKWLGEKSIAIKIDAEAQQAVAARYDVTVYPTLIFLTPDGREFERLLGYIEPDAFKKTLALVETGKTSLMVAKEKLDAAPDNPLRRLDYADELAMRQRWDDAWKEYLWCYQEGVKKDATFAKLRDSYLLSSMMAAGENFEKARDYLINEREQAEKRIQAGQAQPGDYQLFVQINFATDENDRSLSALERVKSAGSTEAAKRLVDALLPLLVRQGRYQDIASQLDLSGEITAQIADARQVVDYLNRDREPEQAAEIRSRYFETTALRLTDHYQVLLGLGRADPAAEAAKKILDMSSTYMVYGALAWSGYLSGKPVEANVEQARKALDLYGSASADILDTLARLLHARGRTDEAIRVCEDALAKTNDLRDRFILQQCIDDFRAGGQGAKGP